MTKQIEEYIKENLIGEAQTTALEFVTFLRSNNIEFYKDNGSCWKDKIYYWLKFKNECVAFIAIKDPDEPENLWTVWSDDSKAFETDIIDDKIKNTAWKHIDFCGHCGSCGGGKRKVVFGKEFSEVCGCTFRIDNPQINDLPFLKKMVELSKLHISNNSVIEHYDLLIGENNDPVHDPKPLRDYMDKWDGQAFIDKMELDKENKVLEIGVGTGRLGIRVAPLCGQFYGIDISTKTIDRAKENTFPSVDNFSPMVVEDVTYDKKKGAGSAILAACKAMTSPEAKQIGSYRGFNMELSFNTFEKEYILTLVGSLRHSAPLGGDIYGNITRIDNLISSMPDKLKVCEERLSDTKTQLENAKLEVERPFTQEEELSQKMERLAELNALLDMDHKDNEIVEGEPDGVDVSERKEREIER